MPITSRFLGRVGVAVAVLATALTQTALSNSATAAGPAPDPQLVTAATTGDLGADNAIACPIPSGSDFIDSWGASRSGGRRHEGVDMIADRGTPVVAAQSGDVNFKQNRLGGNAAWLSSPNGNTFYYAHFDSFEGESRFVLQGELIGYVGSTGNAKGPHLHFETHFGGTVGSPYDATYAACVQPIVDALQAAHAAHAAADAANDERRTHRIAAR
jgi:murein DD-endopeptidase MepM/ murein hydrolase activator NlpD